MVVIDTKQIHPYVVCSRCYNEQSRIHLAWCQHKCKFYNECEDREQVEYQLMLYGLPYSFDAKGRTFAGQGHTIYATN